MTDEELLDAAWATSRGRIDALKAAVAAIDAAKKAQPERLQEMRTRAEMARDAAWRDEPWDELWSALPGIDAETGELSGMLALPSIDAKEMFGARLAFDLAAYAGEEDSVDDILNWYFSAIKSTDHMFLIGMAALKTIATHVLPVLLEIAEEKASNWDVRVNLSDASRNAWEQRVKGGAS